MLATHAAPTARNAGCEICEVVAESASVVDCGLQSSSVQNASGDPVQSPFGQKRGGMVVAAGAVAPGAIEPTSPSAISFDSESEPLPSSPHPSPSRLPPASPSSTPIVDLRIANMFSLLG